MKDGQKPPLQNPLQNKVFPDGSIRAVRMRGLFMGNRGIIHDHHTRTLHPVTRWTHSAWISCLTEFKGRKRTLMDKRKYTELFFLDEVTALSAGHRPCYECRRQAANSFSEAWQTAHAMDARPTAPEMNRTLHAERKTVRAKRIHHYEWGDLPDGAMIQEPAPNEGASVGRFLAKRGGNPVLWTIHGYETVQKTMTIAPAQVCDVLTPPSIIASLQAGYQPQWHPSIDAL
ncbi:MAG: hypothetical protein AAFO98_00790 [Pseudomonadota bacterium]